MKKLIGVLLVSVMLTQLLAGCAQPAGPASSSGTDVSSGNLSSSGSEAPQEEKGMEFTWKPKVYSAYQIDGWGPEMERLYHKTVDAIMAGEPTASCPNEKLYPNLLPLLQTNFPVANGVLSNLYYEDGLVHLEYRGTDEEREQTIQAFKNKIEEYIESSVCETDTPTMAAIALYHEFVGQLHYDPEAAADETASSDVSPYRALMTGEGVCQSFAGAYAYLCLQLGIEAVTASGINSGDGQSHEWVMLSLNDDNHFCDPTYEAKLGGEGFCFFAMDAERRSQDGFDFEEVVLGYNLMEASGYIKTHDSLFALSGIQELFELYRTPEGMTIRGLSDLHGEDIIPIEDGKTLKVIHEYTRP